MNILFNELYYNSISGVSYSPCISRAPRCRFVKVIAHGRRDQRVEADRPSLPRIILTSIAQDSINLLDEFIREIFREIEMSKSYATMSPSREGNHLSIGFEIRTIRALLSSSFSSRVFVHGGDVLARGLWLGVPVEMTPQMEPLWRWSPRDEGEKRERNNYTVRESISMKVVRRPSIERIRASRWKFILSSPSLRTRVRNYPRRVPRKTWMELGIL